MNKYKLKRYIRRAEVFCLLRFLKLNGHLSLIGLGQSTVLLLIKELNPLWHHEQLSPIRTHNRPKAIQTHQPHICRLLHGCDDLQRKTAVPIIQTFATDSKATVLPPSSIDGNKPSICCRNGYLMALRIGYSCHCLSGFRQSILHSKPSSPM